MRSAAFSGAGHLKEKGTDVSSCMGGETLVRRLRQQTALILSLMLGMLQAHKPSQDHHTSSIPWSRAPQRQWHWLLYETAINNQSVTCGLKVQSNLL